MIEPRYCPECDGVGSVPDGSGWMITCEECGGTGEVEEEEDD